MVKKELEQYPFLLNFFWKLLQVLMESNTENQWEKLLICLELYSEVKPLQMFPQYLIIIVTFFI